MIHSRDKPFPKDEDLSKKYPVIVEDEKPMPPPKKRFNKKKLKQDEAKPNEEFEGHDSAVIEDRPTSNPQPPLPTTPSPLKRQVPEKSSSSDDNPEEDFKPPTPRKRSKRKSEPVIESSIFSHSPEELEKISKNALKRRKANKAEPRKRRAANKWTAQEDRKLIQLVKDYGPKNWRFLAEFFENKTSGQLSQHWNRVLCPDIRKGSWDVEEEELLFKLHESYGESWTQIAAHIPNRTDIQCHYQFWRALESRSHKWTAMEKKFLLQGFENILTKSWTWTDVAASVSEKKKSSPPRTALECKQFYENWMKEKEQRAKDGLPEDPDTFVSDSSDENESESKEHKKNKVIPSHSAIAVPEGTSEQRTNMDQATNLIAEILKAASQLRDEDSSALINLAQAVPLIEVQPPSLVDAN